ncbi:Gfo/Idh/MocA family protein [Paenibacillus sp. 1P07SE]|uniref:Gfo/Idh/MocA family protein n=1 Tax=Paenibacillus sp. 1P07SE TaxID=3132209 RepID=UPI0039A4A527
MEVVRLGVIGLGNMGKGHIRYIVKGEIPGLKLTAVSDIAESGRQWALDHAGEGVSIYSDPYDMLDSGKIDGVLITTPHYSHPELAIACFQRGLHVLVEKPAGVYTKQVREMNEAFAKTDLKFSMMYNQRTNPLYRKLKEMVDSGELGEIRRTNWIITTWYRSQSYYDSGTWRATWEGEGGGVLLNQDPHQLDLWQWMISMMPRRVRAFCSFGKYRDIEVEDDVTAYVEYENGASGVFVTTTGETPGTNRLEIIGDRGKVVIEDDKLTFWRLRVSETEFNATYKGGFGQPECWKCEVPVVGENTNHQGIMRNWTNAILHGEELIAPGEEGIKGLMLANAMLLSTWTDNWVNLPIDEELYVAKLQERVENSRYRKEK